MLLTENNDLPDCLNDHEDSKKHPRYKSNLCRNCYKHNTVYYCARCSVPTARKLRKEKGPRGQAKHTEKGYTHFCKNGCFSKHNCGKVSRRRSKAEMENATDFRI